MQPAVASRVCEWMTSRTRETHSCRPPELHSPEAELRRLAMMGLSLREERGEQSVVLTERKGKENERLKEKEREKKREGESEGRKNDGAGFRIRGYTLRRVCVNPRYTNLYPEVRSSSPFVSFLSMNRCVVASDHQSE